MNKLKVGHNHDVNITQLYIHEEVVQVFFICKLSGE